MSWSVNSTKSDSLGPDLVVQAYSIDRACGRPASWIRPLVASLMSIYFTGNHRQYTLFDYIVKLCFAILYSCVLSEISLLLLLLTVDSLQKFCPTVNSLCNPRDHCTHSLFQDYCIVKLITPNQLTYLHTSTTLWRGIVLYALVPKTMHGVIVGKRVRTRRLGDRYCTRV